MGLGFKIAAVMGVVTLLLLGGFYAYFKYSQGRIEVLMADNAKLESAVRLNEEAIKAMKARAEQQAKQVVELQQGLNEANAARKELEQKFRKHDLEALARENSKALELRMNRATQRVWEDLEVITGGKPPQPIPETKPAPLKSKTFKTLEEINAQ